MIRTWLLFFLSWIMDQETFFWLFDFSRRGRARLESNISRWRTEAVWWDSRGTPPSGDTCRTWKISPALTSAVNWLSLKRSALRLDLLFLGHVDVNVHLPQMFTELSLNKLFVPHLQFVLVLHFDGLMVSSGIKPINIWNITPCFIWSPLSGIIPPTLSHISHVQSHVPNI